MGTVKGGGGVPEFPVEFSPRLCVTMFGVDSRTCFANQRVASAVASDADDCVDGCRGECCDGCLVDCGVSAQQYSVVNDVISYEIRCRAWVGVQACREFDTVVSTVDCL